ncbi:hypothetical protein NC651_020323 [Populus alba x Populus x berolinensis]|nr:hypothetical protein NC651_020323 [Populus alba x Populus x berolinensis]
MLHEEQKFLLLVKRPIISLVVDETALVQHFHRAANAEAKWKPFLLRTICRVKESLRHANEKASIPDKVSIGPYRHGTAQVTLRAACTPKPKAKPGSIPR